MGCEQVMMPSLGFKTFAEEEAARRNSKRRGFFGRLKSMFFSSDAETTS
jgi:hypothetical protein